MPRCISPFAELFALVCLVALGRVGVAHAQACCAGASAITPGRLAMHERALVGAQLRSSVVLGSFDPSGVYATNPPHTSDVEFEQDLFGTIRLFDDAQVSLLLPFLQARRADRSGSEFGGGIGDIALSARYDFTLAGRADNIPGIGLLAGMTLPSGTPPEQAHRLGTNATGIGVVQGSVGLSLEQTFGNWFINAIGTVAFRATRDVADVGETALAPQWGALLGAAYVFARGASLSASVQYSTEGDATIAGVKQPMTARRRTLLTVAGLLPLSDAWQLRGYVMWDPPLRSLGKNQLSNTGIGVTAVYAWL